ncbi:SDR family oxidoreductase [Roseobacter sp. HKCCA0434]|uniref:SDR family oxidoreductase n=1 Tax=Roseobacter sp. HKCCA0434 TaxID=3079297 RepID=UPI0029059C39|nr:SDR family oxidoreductase [Roseobacter sp. HKCCA0434]
MNGTGRVAIIAGGTAGVGRAVVESLLADGWHVGVIARGQDRLTTLDAEHDNVAVARADVSDASALDAAADDLVARLGRPDVWVNCAMLTSFSPFLETEVEEFEAIVATTFLGQVNGTRAALRLMGPTGRIVNVGSGLSYRAVPFQAAYCAAKHAINGFTSAVRSELIRSGREVTLSLVQLPAINTPQFDWARNRLEMKPQPAPPIYAPQVAAKAVLRAIEKGERELLVGGSVLKLLFGDMALPAWLDRKLAKDGAEMQKSGEPEPGGREDNLFTPAEHAGTAHGRFSDRAKDEGLIVDGDLARKLVFGGGAVALVVLGMIIG